MITPTPTIPHRTPAPPLGYVHVALPELQRWGCHWQGRGRGVVVARVELAGSPAGYDVVLANGTQARALPADIHPAFAPVPR